MGRGSFIPLCLAILIIVLLPFKEFQFIGIFTMGLYLISGVIHILSRRSFRVYRDSKIQYCKNGNRDRINLTIENRSPFIQPSIEISDKGGGCYNVGDGTFIGSFKPGEFKLFSTPVASENRGKHRIGPVVLKGSDPFKLFPWSITIDKYVDIIIYPKIYPLEFILSSGNVGGNLSVLNPAFFDATSLKGIRKYLPGDPIKSINWKSSAKTGTLQVMEFFNTMETPMFILLDIDKNNYPIRYRYQYIERSIETAASLTVSNGTKNQPCGIFIINEKGRGFIPISYGEDTTVNILELLSTLELDPGESKPMVHWFLDLAYQPPQGSGLIIISPDLKRNTPGIRILENRGYRVTRISTGGALENCEFRVDLYNREDISV